MANCLPDNFYEEYSNVIMCFTAENQNRADERIPILLTLPFHEKHIMCAPMITEITLDKYLKENAIRGVLVDGENYEGRRPLRYEWVNKLYNECKNNSVNFSFVGTGNVFVKENIEYSIPKAYQEIQAKRSGLQIPNINTNIPIQNRCATCERRFRCNGCKQCGRCR